MEYWNNGFWKNGIVGYCQNPSSQASQQMTYFRQKPSFQYERKLHFVSNIPRLPTPGTGYGFNASVRGNGGQASFRHEAKIQASKSLYIQ
jgi:hypothetical protein